MRIEIYLDILDSVEKVRLQFGIAKPTRVAYQVNLPYDKFVRYLKELRELGMLQTEKLEVTAKGYEFRTESKKLFGIMGASIR